MSVIKFGTWQALNGTEVANSTDPVGDGGLVFIKSQTIGNGVSSVTVSDAFSSTYDNYKVIIYCSEATTTTRYMRLTYVQTSGAEDTSSNYSSANFVIQAGSTTRVATDGYGMAYHELTQWHGYTDTAFSLDATIMLPYASNHTVLSGFSGGGTAANVCGGFIRGSMNSVTQYSGFKVTASAGTISGGTIRVYGYRQ